MGIKHIMQRSFTLAPLALMVACGGEALTGEQAAGRFSLAVTDAPVDAASSVVVTFTGVSLQPTEGELIEFTFDEPKSVDLLTLQGQVSEYLMTAEAIPAGDYEWVRLGVQAEVDGIMDSYVELDDGSQLELFIPSGAETGLKLVSGFTVSEAGDADYTVDFDLRKSIVLVGAAAGSAIMKPTLRIVDTLEAGSVEGEVDAMMVAAMCDDAGVNDGAVYAFPGNVSLEKLDSDAQQAIASAMVNFEDGAYRYELGFMPPGAYKVAFSCDGDKGDLETGGSMTFVEAGRERVRVTVGENVILDFVPGEGALERGELPGKDKAPEAPEDDMSGDDGMSEDDMSDLGGKPENPGKPEGVGKDGDRVDEETPEDEGEENNAEEDDAEDGEEEAV